MYNMSKDEVYEAEIKGKVVFVSVPYSKDPVKGRELSVLGAKLVKELEGIPYSPVFNFEPLFDNGTEYNVVIKACIRMLSLCEEAIFITEDGELSNGQTIEYEHCKSQNIPHRIFDLSIIHDNSKK